jgi:UDP-N-acetylmuramoyl-tripeptide--D-alanyl-D-alanine ligase
VTTPPRGKSAAWTERAVREALGLPGGKGKLSFSGISTDTRTIAPGSLFVALAGEQFDAHDFLDAAAKAGAAAAVVRPDTPAVPGLALIEVPDPLRAYGQLALARRRQVEGPVIAITGTNGKTSTKEMVAAVLRTRWRTHATRANLNNLVGVPQTILEAPADTEALVVEAGASLPGEIARYRAIIEPSISIVTNATAGHVEGFRSLEGVVVEKLELVRDVPVVFVGTTPPSLAERSRALGAGRVVTIGLAKADLVPQSVEVGADGRPTVTMDGRSFVLPLLGAHQAENAIFAWAVARELGLDLDACASALSSVALPKGRGEVIQSGQLTIVNDSYNANPASFRSIISVARKMREGRRLVFVAGTMRELGDASDREHFLIAEAIVGLKPDLLAVVGEFVPAVAPWTSILGERLLTAEDAPSLAPRLASRLRGNELVILKASRGVALERILPAVTSRAAPPASEA